MFNLVITDFSGNEIHYSKDIYDLQFSFTDKGGPLALTAVLPIDLISPKVGLFYDVSLYHELEEIWLGRVKEIPSVTRDRQGAVVTCEGYFKHLSDDRYNPSYTMPKTADQIIKDVLTNACPKISTDQTKIAVGPYSIQEFEVNMSTTPMTLIERANAYEGYDWGLWDRGSDDEARMTWKAHDRSVIDYYVTLKNCKPDLAGKSIEELYNKAYILYGDFYETNRTATNQTLTDAGITRAISLSDTSLTLGDAQQYGDEYLNIKSKPQGKGQLEIWGDVRDRYGRKIEAIRLLPGKNILIRDLEVEPDDLATFSSSDVLNGKNCFKIVEIDIDAKKRVASCQIEMAADRLDVLLARMAT